MTAAIPEQAGSTRVESVVHLIARTCVDNETYFSDLDAVAGDGDFGHSLARGFENVLAEFEDYDRTSHSVFLQKVATTMSSRIGGTSGPIWGTAFLRASTAIKDHDDIYPTDVVTMVRAAVEGIKKRGGADIGDKTLLDALVPLADALESGIAEGEDARALARRAATAAREAADATATLQARRGRASYTGERSIGSPDPGAVAVAVLAERIADEW